MTEADILKDLIKDMKEDNPEDHESLEALEAKLYKLQFGEEFD